MKRETREKRQIVSHSIHKGKRQCYGGRGKSLLFDYSHLNETHKFLLNAEQRQIECDAMVVVSNGNMDVSVEMMHCRKYHTIAFTAVIALDLRIVYCCCRRQRVRQAKWSGLIPIFLMLFHTKLKILKRNIFWRRSFFRPMQTSRSNSCLVVRLKMSEKW